MDHNNECCTRCGFNQESATVGVVTGLQQKGATSGVDLHNCSVLSYGDYVSTGVVGGALTGIGLGATAFLLGAAALTGWCYLRSRRVSPKEHNSDDRDVLFYGDDSLWRLSQKA